MSCPQAVLPPSPYILQLTPEMIAKRPSANLPCLGSAFDSFWTDSIARLGKGRVILLADIEFVWSCLPRTNTSIGRQERIEAGILLLEVWLQSDLKGVDALEHATAFFEKAVYLTERMNGGVARQTSESNRVGGVALLSLLRLGRVAPSQCGSPPPASASIPSLASTFSLACSRMRELNSSAEIILSGALNCLLCRRELQPLWDAEVLPALRRLAAEAPTVEADDYIDEKSAKGIKRKATTDSTTKAQCTPPVVSLLPPLASSSSSVA